MADANVSVTERGHITTITMDRVERKNALTAGMCDAMADALDRAARDESRAVLLEGAGGCFTSGYDIQEFVSNPPKDGSSPVLRFLRTLAAFEKPVVAAVRGHAVGVGTTMLLHCDFVYADATASFRTPFVNMALVPEGASSLLLPQVVGARRATEMLLLGETLDAAEAEGCGLVTRVFEAKELAGEVGARLERLSGLAPGAVRAAKALVMGHGQARVIQTLEEEGRVFVERLGSAEFAEAAAAFFEKRKPQFK